MRRLHGTKLEEQFRLLDTGAGARRFREDGAEHTSPIGDALTRCAYCMLGITARRRGRPPVYCNARCRQRAHRSGRRLP